MKMYEDLRKHAQEVDDYFLEQEANGHVINHSIDINYDDRAVDAYYFLNRPLKWIKVDVTIKKAIE